MQISSAAVKKNFKLEPKEKLFGKSTLPLGYGAGAIAATAVFGALPSKSSLADKVQLGQDSASFPPVTIQDLMKYSWTGMSGSARPVAVPPQSHQHQIGNLTPTLLDGVTRPEEPKGVPQRVTISTVPGEKYGAMSLQVAIDSTIDGTPLGAGGPVLRSVLKREIPPSELMKLKAGQPRLGGQFSGKSGLETPMPTTTIQVTREGEEVKSQVLSDQEIPRDPDARFRFGDRRITENPQMRGRYAGVSENVAFRNWDGHQNTAMTVPEQLGFMADAAAGLLAPETGADHQLTEQYMKRLSNGVGLEVRTSVGLKDTLFVSLPGEGVHGADYIAKGGSVEDVTKDRHLTEGERKALRTDVERYRQSRI